MQSSKRGSAWPAPCPPNLHVSAPSLPAPLALDLCSAELIAQIQLLVEGDADAALGAGLGMLVIAPHIHQHPLPALDQLGSCLRSHSLKLLALQELVALGVW